MIAGIAKEGIGRLDSHEETCVNVAKVKEYIGRRNKKIEGEVYEIKPKEGRELNRFGK